MDDDLRELLKEIGTNLQDVARQVASTKSSMESIRDMRDCLRVSADTLDTYLRIQKDRYDELEGADGSVSSLRNDK